MRICIYKTDEAPDLTLFLREGLSIPNDTWDRNWVPLKTITHGELGIDRVERISQTGYCVERLGKSLSLNTPVASASKRKRISLRWLYLQRAITSRANSHRKS